MVAQGVNEALHIAEKAVDSMEKAVNNGQQTEEELALKQVEMAIRKGIHTGLNEVSKNEGTWGKSDWGTNSKSKTEEITW